MPSDAVKGVLSLPNKIHASVQYVHCYLYVFMYYTYMQCNEYGTRNRSPRIYSHFAWWRSPCFGCAAFFWALASFVVVLVCAKEISLHYLTYLCLSYLGSENVLFHTVHCQCRGWIRLRVTMALTARVFVLDYLAALKATAMAWAFGVDWITCLSS